jgi:uncharacterized membrane protein YsdA (DUF1294 family)/cold shock CspA family protein
MPPPTMRHTGTLRTWHDDRGFGFIAPTQGGREVFVHRSAFGADGARPTLNERLSYDLAADAQGRPRALQVQRLAMAAAARGPKPAPVLAAAARSRLPEPQRPGRPAPAPGAASWGTATLFAIPALLVVYVALSVLWRVPGWVALAYLALSALCYAVYAADKSAAAAGRRRVSENTLLALGLLGGWPGALLAQQRLRHKSVKPAFRRAFWATVLANGALLLVLSSPPVAAWQAVASVLRALR